MNLLNSEYCWKPWRCADNSAKDVRHTETEWGVRRSDCDRFSLCADLVKDTTGGSFWAKCLELAKQFPPCSLKYHDLNVSWFCEINHSLLNIWLPLWPWWKDLRGGGESWHQWKPSNRPLTYPPFLTLLCPRLERKIFKHVLEADYSWELFNNMWLHVCKCKQQSVWSRRTSHVTLCEVCVSRNSSSQRPLAPAERLAYSPDPLLSSVRPYPSSASPSSYASCHRVLTSRPAGSHPSLSGLEKVRQKQVPE